MRSQFSSLSLAIILILQVQSNCGLNYRLDTNVIPAAYNIIIKPFLLPEDGAKQFTFDGEVQITLHATIAAVREIILHKSLLNITDASLHNIAGNLVQNFTAAELVYETETHKLSVQLQQPLDVNVNYTLNFNYNGQIRDGMAGFYRVNYTNEAGMTKWIGVTQLQRIDARTVFPCFDEPSFKAKFRMSISRPKKYNSIFNTKLLSSAPHGEDRVIDSFDETPLMSTYLVAFIISDYVARGDAEFAIISRPDYYNKTKFSYDVGRRTLQAYDDYTKLPYKQLGNAIMQKASTPKFPHNGMENWGLVIYKDAVLVHEPGYTDGWANKEYTITILVHETAHMWFGNSVTFAWWSYFWLNEAFARYYQYFLAHVLYPEYQLNQQFVVQQLQMIFGKDAINDTQPMTSNPASIQSQADIGSKFSSIAYAKGASILRMISNLMGHLNFDNAIHEYLKANHLQNTVPNDLFLHLKRHWPIEQKVDLDQFFYDWTEQVGFPLLNVTVSANKSYVTISQQRFLLNSSDGSDTALRYTIPITYTTDLQPNFDKLTPLFYLNKTNDVAILTLDQPINWIIFNLQQSNYYRVFYDRPTLRQLQQALAQPQHSNIHIINRAQLVDDLFNYGRVGLLDYDVVFEFMEYLAQETEYLPWYAGFLGMQRIAQRLNVAQHQEFSKFLLDITQAVYAKLGFHAHNDTVLDVYNRNKVISSLCRYGHDDCNRQAQNIFLRHNETATKPTPDFRETLYCSAMRNGDFTYYKTLESWYHQETFSSEQELLLRSMGCTREFYKYHYERILSDGIPQTQKVIALTPLYTQNLENVTPVFELITSTIEDLAKALGSWESAANVICDIANYFTTNDQHKMLDTFVVAHGKQFGYSFTKLQEAVSNVESNLEWANQRLGKLFSYLKERNNAIQHNISASLLMLMLGIYHLIS